MAAVAGNRQHAKQIACKHKVTDIDPFIEPDNFIIEFIPFSRFFSESIFHVTMQNVIVIREK